MRFLIILILPITFSCLKTDNIFEEKRSSYENLNLDADTIEYEIVYHDEKEETDTSGLLIHYEENAQMNIGLDSVKQMVKNGFQKVSCSPQKMMIVGLVKTDGSFTDFQVFKADLSPKCLKVLEQILSKIKFIPGKLDGQLTEARVILAMSEY